MNEDDQTLMKIKAMVAKQTGVRVDRISKDTKLNQDLGMDGLDAANFMEDFSSEFGVDLTEFEFDRYFGPELGFNPFLFVWWRLFDRRKLHFDPITVGDLFRSATSRRWVSPAALPL